MAFMSAMQLGVKLQVQTAGALTNMRKLGQVTDRVRQSMSKLSAKMRGAQEAIQGVQMVSAAVNVALGVGAYKAASFESQMSGVQSVMLATDSAMEPLIARAKELGRTTAFSATEVGEAMEHMARAGIDSGTIIQEVGGILDAAAADQMGLGEAAQIVAANMKAFSSQNLTATEIADALAMASSKSMSSISTLGQSLRNVSATAEMFNIPFNEVVASVAAMQDVGLDASTAGTAMNTMLNRLANPSDTVSQRMRELGINVRDAQGNMLPLPQVLENLSGGLQNAGGNMDQVALLSDMMGLRAQKAGAILSKMSETGRFQELTAALNDSEGAAKRMAEIRLDNLKGQLTLMASALEGVAIELFTGVNAGFQAVTESATDFFSAMAEGMSDADTEGFAAQFGSGFKMAFDTAAQIMQKIMGAFEKIGALLDETFGAGAGQKIGMFAGFLTLALAVVGPLTVAVTGIAAVVVFLGKVLVPIGIAMGVIFAALGAGFAGVAADGTGALDGLKAAIMPFVEQAKAFFVGLFGTIRENWDTIVAAFQPAIDRIKMMFTTLGESFGSVMGESSASAGSFGESLGQFITIIAQIIAFVVEMGLVFYETYLNIYASFISPIVQAFMNVYGGFVDLITGATSFGNAIGRIFGGIGDVMISPIKGAVAFLLRSIRTVMSTSVAKYALKAMGMDADAAVSGLTGAIEGVSSFSLAPAREVENAEDILAEVKDQRTTMASPEANPVEATVENRQTIELNNCLNVDGRNLAVASANQEIEIQERAGFTDTAWQRRQVLEGRARALPAGG